MTGRGGYVGPRPDLAARNRGDGGLYEDREWCRSHYEGGMSFREMAAEAGCSLRTIARWMRLHGIDVVPGHVHREQRGNTPRGERSGNWKGGGPHCIDCGRKCTGTRCADCRYAFAVGPNNQHWRGDDIRNPQAHNRVKKLYGSASTHSCHFCDGRATEWAYDHLDPDERQDPEGPYSVNPAHYMPLCAKCHRNFDLDYRRRRYGSAQRPRREADDL